ncbi:MAG: hypothetical protein LKI94_06475 [Sporolactobacillus sp.]|jgi:YNFM family putative membrane transporter|nr:hypothetical protein [Sporolactobacillus sp.]
MTMVTMLVGLLLTLLSPLWLKIVGAAVFTFGFFGSHSIASGWISAATQTNIAAAASLYLFFYDAGSSLVGTFGGTIWHQAGWPGVVLLIICRTGAAFMLTLPLPSKREEFRHRTP